MGGKKMNSLIDPSSVISITAVLMPGVAIDKNCFVGSDVFLGRYTILRESVTIGSQSVIGHLVLIEKETRIGQNTTIQSQCHITAGADIGDKVFFGPGAKICNDRQMVYLREEKCPFIRKGPVIKDGCRIGTGAIILPGVTLAKETLVGAGSVVTKDTEPFGIYIGVPAKLVGYVPEEERL
jgi:UDP-3-O-[3-hydroxymyristoyl] glucosamine N-acyltransferase